MAGRKRAQNPRVKETRARSWRNSQDRKQARVVIQTAQAAANKVLRRNGEPTAWERACAARAARRHALA
jgi:hypothetical protein